MITFLIIVAITVYLFIGIVTASAIEDIDDSDVIRILMAWPLLLLVMTGMWIGNKIRSKINK